MKVLIGVILFSLALGVGMYVWAHEEAVSRAGGFSVRFHMPRCHKTEDGATECFFRKVAP